jgi:DNA-binding NtrC family response regulator
LNVYDWPGNVRELENIVERAMILKRNEPLTFDGVVWPSQFQKPIEVQSEETAFQSLDEMTAGHIRQALSLCKGKVYGSGGAARLLKINPNTLRHRMRRLGIVAKGQNKPGSSPNEYGEGEGRPAGLS